LEEEENKKIEVKRLKKEELTASLEVLKSLVEDSDGLLLLDEKDRIELLKSAGILSRPDRTELKKRRKALNNQRKNHVRDKDRTARGKTGIRSARTASVFTAPDQLLLPQGADRMDGESISSPRNCYVCKKEFTLLHPFYDTMCQSCGDLNYQKRFQTADLRGQVALMTGSRLKIGYHVTLMMLRAGATVIATTRFPADSAIRFAKEKDYQTWCDRLHIHGLDLRHTPSVELFCSYIEQTYERLDILINNAAQTVRRPPGFYAHMMELEEVSINSHAPEVQYLLRSHKNCIARIEGASGVAKDTSTLAVSWNAKGPGIGLRA
jgi:hypothetical protein